MKTRKAFFGVRWNAGEIPTFYIDANSIQMIFAGHRIAYGRPVNSHTKSHSHVKRYIFIYKTMTSEDPIVKITLDGSTHTINVENKTIYQSMSYNLPTRCNVSTIAKSWDAGWKTIGKEHQYLSKELRSKRKTSTRFQFEENQFREYGLDVSSRQ